jgi:hypothetical protein
VTRPSSYIGTVLILALALAAAAAMNGCSGSTPPLIVPNPSAPLGLPAAPVAGPVNTYFGAQSPGTWTLTLDNTNNIFSYQSVTYPASPNTPVSGTIEASHGFTVLTSGGTSTGYALEVMGRFAILRPGGVNTPPVLAAPQTSCYQLTGRSRFQYEAVPAGATGVVTNPPTFGYGSLDAQSRYPPHGEYRLGDFDWSDRVICRGSKRSQHGPAHGSLRSRSDSACSGSQHKRY